MSDLTTFKFDLLAALYRDGPLHGLGIKEHLLGREYDAVNHGRMYPNLDDLVAAGYVDKSEWDKRTNKYALTDSGEAALADRVEALGGSVRHMGGEAMQNND